LPGSFSWEVFHPGKPIEASPIAPDGAILIDCIQEISQHSVWRPIMARRCQLTGKKANNAMAVSHSHIRTKKLQEVNLQWKRLWWAEGNRFVRLRLSTKALKTVQAKGLAAYAKEMGVNLAKV
jgi:large subunit ribosomal protein L28